MLCTRSGCHRAPSCSCDNIYLPHTYSRMAGSQWSRVHAPHACMQVSFPTVPSQPTGFLHLRLPLTALPSCKETCLFLSQPFLFAHLSGRLLEGGGLSPWFSTGSLWPSWPLWVSELPFCLNRCTGTAAAASAVCPSVGSAPFPKASSGRVGGE